jgi:hypothetical protein
MHLRFASLLVVLFSIVSLAVAAEKPAAPAKPADDYPLKTCVVSDEPLSADAVIYTHREAGKPDRILRFCCEGCIEDFKSAPAKFLKKLDDAAKEQPKKK